MKHGNRWFVIVLVVAALTAAVFALWGLAGPEALAEGSTIYVDADATGAGDGTSWEDAYVALQPALEEAAEGDQIWVAAGTYTPSYEFSPGDPRSATFQLKNGVGLYGGLDPTIGDVGWDDRDWVNNVTTLSGDIGTPGEPGDNSYHVFFHPPELALDGSAVLDGFTVTAGNASVLDGTNHSGGGMYNDHSSPAVMNCTFSGNSAYAVNGGIGGAGGGMYNHSSSPAVANCTFSGNEAAVRGGGMFNGDSSPTVTGCTFSGNNAQLDYGGGMYNGGSSPVVTNCTFSRNRAGHEGGGMHNNASSPVVTNCTFSGNKSVFATGGGMYNDASSPVVTNCILWGDNPDEISGSANVTHSDVQGGYSGAGNIDADPLFVDPGMGDYHLLRGSPCIDAGSNDAPNLPDFDFEGDPRVMDGNRDGTAIVDMGVDEVYGYILHLPLIFRSY